MSKFKADNGRRLTQGLFYEFNNPDAPYTLRTNDYTSKAGKTYKSVYKMYMESVDEYDAAMKILGDWGHWELLCENKWFMEGHQYGSLKLPGVKDWREHMRMRDESIAKGQLLKEAQNGSVQAQKIIYEASKGKGSSKKKNSTQSDTGVSSTVSSLLDRRKQLQGG